MFREADNIKVILKGIWQISGRQDILISTVLAPDFSRAQAKLSFVSWKMSFVLFLKVAKVNFVATAERFLEERKIWEQSGIARGWWCHADQGF